MSRLIRFSNDEILHYSILLEIFIRRESIISLVLKDDSFYEIKIVTKLRIFVERDSKTIFNAMQDLKKNQVTKIDLLNNVSEKTHEMRNIYHELHYRFKEEIEELQKRLKEAETVIAFFERRQISIFSLDQSIKLTKILESSEYFEYAKSVKILDLLIFENNKNNI
jgi:hypothetical protein